MHGARNMCNVNNEESKQTTHRVYYTFRGRLTPVRTKPGAEVMDKAERGVGGLRVWE